MTRKNSNNASPIKSPATSTNTQLDHMQELLESKLDKLNENFEELNSKIQTNHDELKASILKTDLKADSALKTSKQNEIPTQG